MLAVTCIDRLNTRRQLPVALLDESVDGEWSYVQTLRHLVHAIDRWISGPVLGESQPFDPLGLPNPPHEDLPPAMFDFDARPRLDEVLVVRRGRMNRVEQYLDTVTTEQLAFEVVSPNGGMATVWRCFQVVFREEWWHDQYARRDIATLEQGFPASG